MNKIISTEIEPLIYEIRGKEVMLDSDLASLYGCKNGTKDINKAVKRNINRFPDDFYFQLTDNEFNLLRLQFGTAKPNINKVRTNPYVFTELGVSMLSSILKTKNAAQISIKIIRAFVNMRHILNNNYFSLTNQTIKNTNQISIIENEINNINEKIDNIFLQFKSSDFKELIYFNGQIYDAYSKIIDILNKSKKEIIIIDSYADKSVLDIISNIKSKVILITKENLNLKRVDLEKYFSQYKNLEIIYDNTFHDRYFILDNEKIYHCGASINHAGKKTFSINKLEDKKIITLILKTIEKISQNNKKYNPFDI